MMGKLLILRFFGGSNDDFVRCIDLLHDQIILGGEFSSSTWLHGKEYQARGSNDYFFTFFRYLKIISNKLG